MDLTLDSLLKALDQEMTKVASDEECTEEKEKKAETKTEDKSEGKGEKKEEKKGGDDHTKEASEAGAELARQVMEKVASAKLETTGMNKQATTAGQALAKALMDKLTKSANAGDATTVSGVADGAAGNKQQNDSAQIVAEDDAKVKPMPTGDGLRNQGTINQIFDAVIADALAQGAASHDQVHETGVSSVEGSVEDKAVPNQVKTASEKEMEDAIEKAAAVEHLVQNGIAFEDAVDLVKAAETELQEEFEKAAAVSALITEGVDFDDAIELVKRAAAGDMTTVDGIAPGAPGNKVQHDSAQIVAEDDAKVKPMPTGDGIKNDGTINEIFDAIVQDALAQGAASHDQVHGTGVAAVEGAVEDIAVPNQVKTAAMEKLLDAGFDFDTAVELVKTASLKGMISAAKTTAEKALHKAKMLPHTDAATAAKFKVKHTMDSARQGMENAVASAKGAGNAALDKVRATANAAKDSTVAGAKSLSDKVKARAGEASEDFNRLVHGDTGPGTTVIVDSKGRAVSPRLDAAKRLAKNPLVYGTAGGLAVAGAGAGMAMSREKKAAFDALVEAGVDFDEAASLVISKAQELYGE